MVNLTISHDIVSSIHENRVKLLGYNNLMKIINVVEKSWMDINTAYLDLIHAHCGLALREMLYRSE